MSRLNTYNSIHYKESKHICKASIVCIVPSKVMILHVSDRGLDAGQKLEKTTKKKQKTQGYEISNPAISRIGKNMQDIQCIVSWPNPKLWLMIHDVICMW